MGNIEANANDLDTILKFALEYQSKRNNQVIFLDDVYELIRRKFQLDKTDVQIEFLFQTIAIYYDNILRFRLANNSYKSYIIRAFAKQFQDNGGFKKVAEEKAEELNRLEEERQVQHQANFSYSRCCKISQASLDMGCDIHNIICNCIVSFHL